MYSVQYRRVYNFLSSDNIFGDIITFANTTINYSYVGLLETGDMVFLFARSRLEDNILNRPNGFTALKAEIHWLNDRPNVWRLLVYDSRNRDHPTNFDFYVPKRIFDHWKTFNLDKIAALDIKQEFFSRIFVFNQKNNPEVPFTIINIDREWLDQIRNNQHRNGED